MPTVRPFVHYPWQCRCCHKVFHGDVPIASQQQGVLSAVRNYFRWDARSNYCRTCVEGFQNSMLKDTDWCQKNPHLIYEVTCG